MNMSDQEFMGLHQRTNQFLSPEDLKISAERFRLDGHNNIKMAQTMFPNNELRDMDYLVLNKKLQTDPQVVPEHEDHYVPVDVLPLFPCQFFEDSTPILIKPTENPPAIFRAGKCQQSAAGSGDYKEHEKQEDLGQNRDLIVPDQQSAAGSGDYKNHSDYSTSDSLCSFLRRYDSSRGSYYSGSSEDFDEESEDNFVPEVPSATSNSLKRKQSTETHQDSNDKRRRTKVDEKMLVLQDLIPNCNKMDKVEVLDKVIEHLKSLHLQFQMMSMGMNLYIAPTVSPMGMHQMMNPYPQVPYFLPMPMPVAIGHSNNLASSLMPASISPLFPVFQHFPCQPLVQHSLQWPSLSVPCFPSFRDTLQQNISSEMRNKDCGRQ